MRMHLATAAASLLVLMGVGAAVAQDVIVLPEEDTVTGRLPGHAGW